MSEDGLIEVKNPSEIFLSERHEQASGTAIVATIEGARPILLEVQALVSPSSYSQPQRTCSGIDIRRLYLIVAALEKKIGIPFRQQDIFVNVAGGVYLNDPAVDMGIAAALISSQRDMVINNNMALIGEIGLTGEVRSVSQIEKRIQECQKLGFSKAAIPFANSRKLSRKYDIEILPVQRISLLLDLIFS
jgi:DNA repair protein RadA/Sms